MSDQTPHDRRASRILSLLSPGSVGGVAALAVLGAAVTAFSAGHFMEEPAPATIQEVPERFVEAVIPARPGQDAASPEALPDAGEGARAKTEEGAIGRKDARMAKAEGNKVELLGTSGSTSANSGVLGSLRDGQQVEGIFSSSDLDSNLAGGIGGLVGSKGSQIGTGGLGSRGSGPGGGGIHDGLAALGTRGQGSGASGYGSGGGNVAGAGPAVSARLSLEQVAEPRSSGEEYTHPGVNDFVMVADDPWSTFSIDVDTASYTMSRRRLQSGQLPSPAGVRVEEFVNYQRYEYERPTSGPFAVHMEAMPDPFRDGHHTLRVGVQGKDAWTGEREPVHLTFLVDVSGSMSSADKLGLAQDSLHILVDGLGEEDTVALATYAGRVARILPPTAAVDKDRIHEAIASLRSGGSTAMSSGIDMAYEMAWEGFHQGHENRVIILSDGDANVGRTSWDDLLSQIKGYADKGVTLSTIGFGTGNYRDTLMEQLANKGDGNNFYVDSKKQALRVFGEELTSTVYTIARDVKIQVEFNPQSVAAYRLIGYENRDIADKDFRNDRVDAGEVGAGHNVTALYDVLLKDGYTTSLATVRLRWEAPGADKAAVERSFVFRDRDLKETAGLASRDTRVAYSAATFAEVLRGSPHAGEIDLGDLAAFARKASKPGNEDHAELVDLIERADRLMGGVASRGQGGPTQASEPVILGAMARADIDAVMKRHMNQIQYCYEREAAKGTVSYGEVTPKFVVAGDGSVSRAETKSSTLNNAAVEGCIASRIMRFQFPEPQGGGIVIVSYPIAFTPA